MFDILWTEHQSIGQFLGRETIRDMDVIYIFYTTFITYVFFSSKWIESNKLLLVAAMEYVEHILIHEKKNDVRKY